MRYTYTFRRCLFGLSYAADGAGVRNLHHLGVTRLKLGGKQIAVSLSSRGRDIDSLTCKPGSLGRVIGRVMGSSVEYWEKFNVSIE